MALNFPSNPNLNDQYTDGVTTWLWDGTTWNVISSASGGGGGVGDSFVTVASDDGSAIADGEDTLSILGGTNISTAIATDTQNLTINMDAFNIEFLSNVSNASATSGQVLKWDGAQWAPGADISSGGGGSDTTSVIAPVAFGRVADTADASGTNISWSNWNAGTGELDFAFSTAQPDTDYIVVTDAETFDDYHVGISSKTVNGFTASFYDGSGVRAPSGASPFTIMVYGSTPTVDVSVGANADTLDGFEGTYYLDYNNFTNTPSVVTLTDLSVGNELAASGDGAISYDNTTGVFRYTPPDLSTYLTAEANDLTAAVTWANVPDDNITQSSVTQHQSALSITESQISDFGTYLTSVSATDLNSISIDALSDVDTTTAAPTNGQVLAWDDTSSTWKPAAAASGGGGGEVNQNAFSSIVVSGQTTVAADTTTDSVSFITGTGIQITTDAVNDTITFTNTQTPGATALTGLTDANTAGLTVDQIYESAAATFRVDNSGTSAYTIDSHYSGNNPTIYLLSGMTWAFDLNAISGHPFELQDSTGTALSSTNIVHVDIDGTVSTGSNAQGKDRGTLYWRVPESLGSPPNYRYQCTIHTAMVGAITLKRLSTL